MMYCYTSSMEHSGTTCSNCAKEMVCTAEFCSHCGQKKYAGRLRLAEILTHFSSEVLTWDSKYIRTIRELTTRPAQVCENYVAGKRACYVNPLKYCLTLAALFFLLNATMGIDLFKTDLGLKVDDAPSVSEEQTALENPGPPEHLEKGRQFITSHINLMIFISVPLKALALWFLFRRSGRNLAETFVFTLYLTGHVYLILLPLSVLAAGLGVVVPGFNPVLDFCLFTWASIGFFDSSLIAAGLKNLAASMFRIIGVALPVGAILLWYVVYFPG